MIMAKRLLSGVIAVLAMVFSTIGFGQEGPYPLYVSKQTGEASAFTGTAGYAADHYESGFAGLSTNGPITVNVAPALTLARDESKTWTGTVTVDGAAAPDPGSSVTASVMGNYTFTYYNYYPDGSSKVVSGSDTLNFVVYSIKVEVPDSTVCLSGNQTQLTASGFPDGGSYEWTTTSSNLSLSNTNQKTVTIQLVGTAGGVEPVRIKYSIGGVTYTADANVLTCNALSNLTAACPHNNRQVGAGGTIEVVPQLIGESITLNAIPHQGEYCGNYPKWSVRGYWTTNLTGTTVDFRAHGFNATPGVPWLFGIEPRSYSISVVDTCGNSKQATVKAYPVNQAGFSWNVGSWLKPAKDAWNALPVKPVEVQWPSDGAKVTFDNAWKERSLDPTAYLWFSASAGFDPLIGVTGRYPILGVPIPSWISKYVDLGLYLVASGAVKFGGNIERGEAGASGQFTASGVLTGGLEGIAKAGSVGKIVLSGSCNILEPSLNVKPFAAESWIKYQAKLDCGKLEAKVSIQVWNGWIEWNQSWLIWEGFNIWEHPSSGQWAYLLQYQ